MATCWKWTWSQARQIYLTRTRCQPSRDEWVKRSVDNCSWTHDAQSSLDDTASITSHRRVSSDCPKSFLIYNGWSKMHSSVSTVSASRLLNRYFWSWQEVKSKTNCLQTCCKRFVVHVSCFWNVVTVEANVVVVVWLIVIAAIIIRHLGQLQVTKRAQLSCSWFEIVIGDLYLGNLQTLVCYYWRVI